MWTHEQQTLADAALTNKLNVIHHAYVDITGDLIAGALLGQILYWFGADRNGKPRARIHKHGYLWIAKARSDWWEEIRISPKQYDRASKILKDKNYIVLKTMKFNGNPTTHIRLNPEPLNMAITEWKRAQVGFLPLGNNESTNMGITFFTSGQTENTIYSNNVLHNTGISLTESTAKSTMKNTAENTHNGVSVDFEEVWQHYPKKIGKAKARKAYDDAVSNGANPLTVMVECALYRQYVEHQCVNDGLERRYIPTGGTWFNDQSWEDETPSISSDLDYEDGITFNKNMVKLRRLAHDGDVRGVKCVLLELPY